MIEPDFMVLKVERLCRPLSFVQGKCSNSRNKPCFTANLACNGFESALIGSTPDCSVARVDVFMRWSRPPLLAFGVGPVCQAVECRHL